MTVISATPDQARAVRSWVLTVLNLSDQGVAESPAPFGAESVRWSDSDYPRAPNPYAMLREVSFVPYGEPVRPRETINAGQVDEALLQYAWTIAEWTVSVQVVSKLDEANPELSTSAGRYLRRLEMRTMGEETTPMRLVGCAWCRTGQILPMPRIANGSQWESRAALDLTFRVGEYIVDRPGWIESVEATGTLDPLAAETLNAAHDDDLDNLL